MKKYNFKEIYASKLVSVEEASKKIESGDIAFFGPCSAAPVQLLEAISDRAAELENVNLISALLLQPYKFLQSSEFIGKINYHTFFLGPYERALKKIGNVNVNSINLSRIPDSLKTIYNINTLIADDGLSLLQQL